MANWSENASAQADVHIWMERLKTIPLVALKMGRGSIIENKNNKQKHITMQDNIRYEKAVVKSKQIFTFPLRLTRKSRAMTCGLVESVAVSCTVNGPYNSLLELLGK